jgi:intein-encoded DNA endonuclease-like protein
VTKEYLLGALHDATERKYTYRLSQKYSKYVKFVAEMIRSFGYKAWTYREGKSRNMYVVEFSKKVLKGTKIGRNKIDYVRGYFDAEGSVPEKHNARFYIYFAQNNKEDLEAVRDMLVESDIKCGVMHIPSKKKPTYWRFYVSSESHRKFAKIVGSWHPIKGQLLRKMI